MASGDDVRSAAVDGTGTAAGAVVRSPTKRTPISRPVTACAASVNCGTQQRCRYERRTGSSTTSDIIAPSTPATSTWSNQWRQISAW
jgi:hypothetical protein